MDSTGAAGTIFPRFWIDFGPRPNNFEVAALFCRIKVDWKSMPGIEVVCLPRMPLSPLPLKPLLPFLATDAVPLLAADALATDATAATACH